MSAVVAALAGRGQKLPFFIAIVLALLVVGRVPSRGETAATSGDVASSGAHPKTSASFVKVTNRLSVDKVHVGEPFEVTVLLDIADGWHIQAAKPTFDYLIPTKLTMSPHEPFQFSDVAYPRPTQTVFAGEKLDVLEGKVELNFKVTWNNGAAYPLATDVLRGKLTVQACDDKTCLAPAKIDIEIPVPIEVGAVPPSSILPAFRGEARPSGRHPPSSLSLWKALLAAFIGGIILNLMPCVLPVIAIKILSFVSQGGSEPRQTRRLGLIFGLGVMISFWALALLVIGLQTAGHQIGWGFQFQDVRFVLAMALIVTVIALNFFGVFEVELSSKTLDTAGSLASLSGTVGAFWNGVLATALATPCTAPFLGAALGFAFSQPPLIILAIFTATGIGLAVPYVVLAWNTRLLKWLPKPGPWLLRFKQAMGFPMLATALWLVWVLGSAYGNKAAIAVAAWLLVASFVIWLVGAIRPGRFIWICLAIILVAMAGYHQLSANFDNQNPTESFRAKLDAALKSAHPVYLDFTADWCLTCQVNKRTSLDSAQVMQRFKELGVEFVVADWTKPDPEIGEALRSFGRSGVPLNVIYPADRSKPPIVLPEILTPQLVLDALAKAAATN